MRAPHIAKSIDRRSSASTNAKSGEPSDRKHRPNWRARPTSMQLAIVANNDNSGGASGKLAKSGDRAGTPAKKNDAHVAHPTILAMRVSSESGKSVAAATATPASPSGTTRLLGSKGADGVYHSIINQMPPHYCYIEPFLGHGAIMKAKRPADRNIGIDRNVDAVAHVRALIPYAELSVGDGIRYLERFEWRGGELVYCDPPYLLETRTSNKRYKFELSAHQRLLELLRRLPCPVILSGYYSPLYAETLSDWRVVTYTGQTRGGPRTEYLWCNFPEPWELHDYRYLGNGFRERERIKKLQRRWVAKLESRTRLERLALFSALRAAQALHDRR
jgi:DNA adenine methylase